MRTTEERTRLIRKRTAELKRGQQRRKQRVWDCVCVAACLLLVVGLGVWMPECPVPSPTALPVPPA